MAHKCADDAPILAVLSMIKRFQEARVRESDDELSSGLAVSADVLCHLEHNYARRRLCRGVIAALIAFHEHDVVYPGQDCGEGLSSWAKALLHEREVADQFLNRALHLRRCLQLFKERQNLWLCIADETTVHFAGGDQREDIVMSGHMFIDLFDSSKLVVFANGFLEGSANAALGELVCAMRLRDLLPKDPCCQVHPLWDLQRAIDSIVNTSMMKAAGPMASGVSHRCQQATIDEASGLPVLRPLFIDTMLENVNLLLETTNISEVDVRCLLDKEAAEPVLAPAVDVMKLLYLHAKLMDAATMLANLNLAGDKMFMNNGSLKLATHAGIMHLQSLAALVAQDLASCGKDGALNYAYVEELRMEFAQPPSLVQRWFEELSVDVLPRVQDHVLHLSLDALRKIAKQVQNYNPNYSHYVGPTIYNQKLVQKNLLMYSGRDLLTTSTLALLRAYNQVTKLFEMYRMEEKLKSEDVSEQLSEADLVLQAGKKTVAIIGACNCIQELKGAKQFEVAENALNKKRNLLPKSIIMALEKSHQTKDLLALKSQRLRPRSRVYKRSS